MDPVMEQATADSLKYRKKEFLHPKYKLSQLYPLSGLQTQTITAAGSTEIVFQIPTKVVNLSKSYFNFTMTPSAATTANAQSFFAHKTPLSCIRQIQLYSQNGAYLCDLNYVNKFLNVAHFAETSYADFSSNGYITSTTVGDYNIFAGPSGNLGTAVSAFNFAQRVVTDNAGVVAALNSAGTNPLSYIERQYFVNGENGAVGAGGAAPVFNIQFPMKYLYDTIFNVDKDLYFAGEVLQLRFVFDVRDSAFFESPNGLLVGNVAMTRDINVSNIGFYLAVEQDPSIVTQVIEKTMSQGQALAIPYVYSYKINNGASTNPSLSFRFNRAHGTKLRRIYHAPFHNTETGATAYCRDNIGGAKTVSQLYTLLNNERLQEFNVLCTSAQDWMVLKNKLKDSTYLNSDGYQNNWFWVDDFTSEDSLWQNTSQDINLSSGIDLGVEQKWDIYMTTTNRALNHYVFAITEREILLRPGAITVS